MKGEKAWPNTVSGLLITMSEDSSLRQETLEALQHHPCLTVGEPNQRWVPVALEHEDARPVHRWIEALPGVDLVDVVFVGLPTEPDGNQPAPNHAKSL